MTWNGLLVLMIHSVDTNVAAMISLNILDLIDSHDYALWSFLCIGQSSFGPAFPLLYWSVFILINIQYVVLVTYSYSCIALCDFFNISISLIYFFPIDLFILLTDLIFFFFDLLTPSWVRSSFLCLVNSVLLLDPHLRLKFTLQW